MIKFEDLVHELEIAQIKAIPFNEEFERVKELHNAKIKELQTPFINLVEAYYDQILIDKNSTPVKVGDIIVRENKRYKVINRGMQLILGKLMNNPKVVCKRINLEGLIDTCAKEKHVTPSGLVEFEKVI
jgi:hypothetical protein